MDDALRERDPVLFKSLHQFDHAHYDARNYGSVVLIGDREACHLIRCVHCSAHFVNLKLPGKERGWCMKCNGPVCPKKECDECYPFMEFLENVERGLPPGQRRISAAIRGDVPQGDGKLVLPSDVGAAPPAPVLLEQEESP